MREATTFSRILEMKLRFEIGRKLLRSSVDRDGFLRRGWTRACLNDDGKIPSERERLTRFVMIGPSSLKQSFRRKVGMESRGHCLLSEAEMSLWISVRVAGIKLVIFGGGAGGERNGSGESDGTNLVRMRALMGYTKKWIFVWSRISKFLRPAQRYDNFSRLSWQKNEQNCYCPHCRCHYLGYSVPPAHHRLLRTL